MQVKKHIYSFGYDLTEHGLCKLESKSIFSKEEKNKQLSSDIKVDPSISAFIKKRLDVISYSEDYTTLISEIKKEKVCIEGFKIEYLVFDGDTTEYPIRLEKLRDVGFSIEGYPDYYKPKVLYALGCYEGVWCFGNLIKNNFSWHQHKQKPCSYSNSIGMNIAKSLVNIAAEGNAEKMILDACCGVGTIMLEACFAGYKIEGCDINWKICRKARQNISHFDYNAVVHLSDIKDVNKRYDAAIIDLPYNLYSSATDNDIINIMESTAKITDRLVIVSTSDISTLISNIDFRILDRCSVSKNGKSNFARRIWVCEKNT